MPRFQPVYFRDVRYSKERKKILQRISGQTNISENSIEPNSILFQINELFKDNIELYHCINRPVLLNDEPLGVSLLLEVLTAENVAHIGVFLLNMVYTFVLIDSMETRRGQGNSSFLLNTGIPFLLGLMAFMLYFKMSNEDVNVIRRPLAQVTRLNIDLFCTRFPNVAERQQKVLENLQLENQLLKKCKQALYYDRLQGALAAGVSTFSYVLHGGNWMWALFFQFSTNTVTRNVVGIGRGENYSAEFIRAVHELNEKFPTPPAP